ncbi:hypothetical protein ACWPMX_03050 [Tsuneonella sp. HG094]|jgi:hypothetical protein
MRRILVYLAIGFAMTAPGATAAEANSKENPDELVCKQEKKVNSRFTTKTCLTRAQWAERAERDKREFGDNQSRHKVFTPNDK